MKLLTLTILIFLTSFSAFADQVFMEPFNPVTPSVTAQGRAYTAIAEGYNALFTNPAGFSRTPMGFTFSTQGGVNTSLSALGEVLSNLSSFQNFNASSGLSNSSVSLVNDIVTKYGFGGNFALGMGWVGGNLGIGLAIQGRTFQKGLNVLNANGPFDLTTGLVVGYSVPFKLGWAKLNVGLDVRPMQKTFNDNIYLVDLLGAGASNISNLTVYNGFGLGWDWGAILDFGLTPTGYWTAGLALRDIGSTVFNFHQYTFSDVEKSWTFANGSNTSPTQTYRIPMTVNVGGSWSPDMGMRKLIVDPRLELDLQIPLEDQFTEPSFWTWIHVGGQIKFLNFLSLRTGLNQGYLTFGFGVKVFALDINASIYTDELGRFIGSYPRNAASIEAALRF